MTGLAIALVLGAALLHASWNYLLKKSGGGIGLVWAFAALSSLLYAPLAAGVVIVQHFEFTIEALAFLFASAVLHTAYYLLLDRGYRHGDLSVIYPLARATGPLLTVVVAVAMLGERPGILALCGAALVVGGAFFLAGNPAKLREAGASRGIAVALLCPLSYILVLTAMVFTPVSYVAPAREISILFAALMGAHWLREGDAPRRVAAAAAMALGVVALAIG